MAPLKRRLAQAADAEPAEAARLLGEAGEIVDVMARGAERTAHIVKDLRSFSRLGEATRKAFDLHEGIEVSLRLLASRWQDRITIHRDFGDLPLLECDAGQLNQVFMNLLANACDAIRDRGSIWITTRVEGAEAVVTIRDDGGGIAPEVLERIFEPFFTTKDVGGGTGLGLAISHGVVTAHGGRIEVESTPGAGATFRIVLPLPASRLTGSRARVDRVTAVEVDYRRYPVLVVDDEPDILRSFSFNYGDDFTVLTAESGAQALEQLETVDPAVIVADQRMPGMTGSEFLERSMTLRPDAVRIVLTGYTDVDASSARSTRAASTATSPSHGTARSCVSPSSAASRCST